MVTSMQRPASSPLEAFLLPPNDPRLHQGRLELAAAKGLGKARAPTDWGRCASRHEKCRFEEGLGTKRPWTDWRDGAICNFPEGYWNDWANAQTERVQDLTDVSHLRAARSGFDAAFRTLVWNLSQNVYVLCVSFTHTCGLTRKILLTAIERSVLQSDRVSCLA